MRVITTVAAIAASLSGDHAELMEDIHTSGAGDALPASVTTHPAASVAPAAPQLADRIADFLRNDQSGYDWRSAGAISKALGDVTEDAVRNAAQTSGLLQGKQSRGSLGFLISLRD